VRKFSGDVRGVVAIEAAIVFPILIAFAIGAFDLWQASSQRTAVVTTAGNIAAIGGRALKTSGPTGARAAVQSAYDANISAGLFTAGSVPSLGVVSVLDANGQETSDPAAAVAVAVTVSADCVPLFPVPGVSMFHASVTVRG
jgi:Flp pilus assembly protein TadG